MSDLELNIQTAFDRLEDIDESWALKLMDECELEMRSTSVDDQEIHVDTENQTSYATNISQTEQVFLSANETSFELVHSSHTTAIERQISLRAEQARTEPSSTEKSVKGFWSFLKRSKAVN